MGTGNEWRVGLVRSGGESVYDFKLRTAEEAGDKKALSAHIRSQKAGVDYDLEAATDKNRNAITASASLRKDKKDFLQGTFQVANIISHQI